ncbi:unnamed protein product, partial [Vitrella brassicaformis CCMP3155]
SPIAALQDGSGAELDEGEAKRLAEGLIRSELMYPGVRLAENCWSDGFSCELCIVRWTVMKKRYCFELELVLPDRRVEKHWLWPFTGALGSMVVPSQKGFRAGAVRGAFLALLDQKRLFMQAHYPDSWKCNQPLLDPSRTFPKQLCLGPRVQCQHCKAWVWKSEGSSFCCEGGRAVLEPLPWANDFKALMSDPTFGPELRKNSRWYNNTFSMTAMGFHARSSVALSFPPGFSEVQMCGRVYHRVLSAEEQPLVWMVYETPRADEERTKRIKTIAGVEGATKGRSQRVLMVQQLVDRLHLMLLKENPFVRQLRMFGEIAQAEGCQVVLEFQYRPHSDEVCVLLPDSPAYDPCERLVCIRPYRRTTTGHDEDFVDCKSPAYESLQYPLIFQRGWLGCCPSMPLSSRTGNDYFDDVELDQVINRRFYTRAFREEDITSGELKPSDKYWTSMRYARQRLLKEPLVHLMPRLGQEYLIDLCARMEDERL